MSRVTSPVYIINEDFSRSGTEQRLLEEEIERKRQEKSSFIAGSIDEVNDKISHLEKELQRFSNLARDGRSAPSPFQSPPSSARAKEIYESKVQEARDIKLFAGVYSAKTNLAVGQTRQTRTMRDTLGPRIHQKNIPKIKKDVPKFVEMCQYPGWDESTPAPLPENTSPLVIWKRAIEAQVDLSTKYQYKRWIEGILLSAESQHFLQDAFWWHFVKTFNDNPSVRALQFKRMSRLYAHMMILAFQEIQYSTPFSQVFPSLVAQSVYAVYCEAFPDSYRQYNERFKESIIVFLSEAMHGAMSFQDFGDHGLPQLPVS